MVRRQVDVKKVLGLLYRYYEFLEAFLPTDREGAGELPCYTLTQLVDKTGKDITYLSKLTDKLSRAGLLEIREEPRDRGGRPYKVSTLSPLGFRLLSAVEEAFRSAEPEKVEIDPWRIEECLSIMEDGIWSEDVRYRFADLLYTIVSGDPVQALSKSDELKKRFERWVTNPPLDGKVGERIRTTVSISIARLAGDEATKEWVISKLYPRMLELLHHSDPTARAWAIGMLTAVAVDVKIKREVADLFLDTLLDRSVEDIEGEASLREMLVKLTGLVGSFSRDEKRSLLAKLKAKAREESRKRTVEYLLDRLMTSIIG